MTTDTNPTPAYAAREAPFGMTGELYLCYRPLCDEDEGMPEDRDWLGRPAWHINVEAETLEFNRPWTVELGAAEIDRAQKWAARLLEIHTDLRVRAWVDQSGDRHTKWRGEVWRVTHHLTFHTVSGRPANYKAWGLTPQQANGKLDTYRDPDALLEFEVDAPGDDDDLDMIAARRYLGLPPRDEAAKITVFLPPRQVASVSRVVNEVPYRHPAQTRV